MTYGNRNNCKSYITLNQISNTKYQQRTCLKNLNKLLQLRHYTKLFFLLYRIKIQVGLIKYFIV